jgi:hypothetical protein
MFDKLIPLLFRCIYLMLLLFLTARDARAITIGAGPVIGTDKQGKTWYQEFQDWTANDLRALDPNDDQYTFSDGSNNSARDMIAFYSHDDGENIYFRFDFFDLGYGEENDQVDVYVAIDCAEGGESWLPDFSDTQTDHPWEACVCVYNGTAGTVKDSTHTAHNTDYLGSYWRNDLDSVEFGIKKSFLTSRGWDGSSAINFQPFICRDGTDGGAGEIADESDLIDYSGTLTRNTGDGTGLLEGAVRSDASTGRAKYAAIAHANQSVNKKAATQHHIYFEDSETGLKPGFVRMIDSAEMFNTPINLHISGTLLMSFLWANQDPSEDSYPDRDGPTFLARCANFVTNGPGSIIGGVLAEHIMTYFEGEVNAKSIQQNSELIEHIFGLTEADMKVMHTPERVIRTDTNSPYVDPDSDYLDGRTFEEIESSGFTATYLDEVTHLHWWFYPNETNNVGWDDYNKGRWAGGGGNDEEPYHHKIHKINGVYCFMINDREDQSKFGNSDGGMMHDTRYTLLNKAMQSDSSQITLVFDDWEAFAGNSFASGTPNNNADQWHNTLRWAANHPWIQLVNLKDVTEWAEHDESWVIDHGYVYDKTSQTYEWLKHACEQSYDHWYYGYNEVGDRGLLEEDFFNRVPSVHNGWAPDGMKIYGDMNHTNTIMRDSWDTIKQITTSSNLLKLAEWSYSAMIYETAWHDELPPADWPPADKSWLSWSDAYKSCNYQVTFDRPEEHSYRDAAPMDYTSGWALKLHAHVRDMGVLHAASVWAQSVRDGSCPNQAWAWQADLDDDRLDEYVLQNRHLFLCFERWGGRLIKGFSYDPLSGDAIAVIGTPISNPADESEQEYANSPRCSALRDHYTALRTNDYIDMDYAAALGNGAITFTSDDGKIRKTLTLEDARDVLHAEYHLAPEIGTLYIRNGLGPNQLDLMFNGPDNLQESSDGTYIGLANTQGGAAYLVAGRNTALNFSAPADTGWEARDLPLVQVFECHNLDNATNFSCALTFSLENAADLDGDGLSNTNEFALGTNHELADTDGDGIPDGYEVQYGLNATGNDALIDADHDGTDNLAEYIAGTDPQNASSRFAAAHEQPQDNAFALTIPTAPDRIYQIYFADSANGFHADLTWQTFANTNSGYGTWIETNDTPAPHAFIDNYSNDTSGAPPTDTRFYRVKVRLVE